MISTLDVVLRVGLAAGLGALVGMEREWRNHAAGARTHALVAAGAALFTLAGAYGFSDIPRSDNVDPMRVAAQVASGIGFVGAGAILRHGASVRGLTTAAALWASAALGLAAGAGFLTGALAGTAIVLVTLLAMRYARSLVLGLERSDHQHRVRRHALTVSYARGRGTLGDVLEVLAGGSVEVDGIRMQDDGPRRDPGRRQTTLLVRGTTAALTAAAAELAELEDVDGVEVDVPSEREHAAGDDAGGRRVA